MATETAEVAVVKDVRIGFWQTTYGILLKRLFFSALATVFTTLYDQLRGGGINWEVVQGILATQVLYIGMTFFRDLQDSHIPDKTEAVKLEDSTHSMKG